MVSAKNLDFGFGYRNNGNPFPPLKGAPTAAQFSAHVCCVQTAGWNKMPLGREVDLVPGVIVLDRDPTPPKNWHSSPPLLSVQKRLSQLRCCLGCGLGWAQGIMY